MLSLRTLHIYPRYSAFLYHQCIRRMKSSQMPNKRWWRRQQRHCMVSYMHDLFSLQEVGTAIWFYTARCLYNQQFCLLLGRWGQYCSCYSRKHKCFLCYKRAGHQLCFASRHKQLPVMPFCLFAGMSAMLEKFKSCDFGRCPRVFCNGQVQLS